MRKALSVLLSLILTLSMAATAYGGELITPPKASDSAVAEYIVRVVDQSGAPVPDVYINFCTDTACTLCQSDADGVITFTGEPYAYHLQILMAPQGYSYDAKAEYYTKEYSSDLTIVISNDEAADISGENIDNEPLFSFPNAGMNLTLPDEYRHTKGTLVPNGGIEAERDSGIYMTVIYYIAMSESDYVALLSDEALADSLSSDRFDLPNASAELMTIYAVSGGRDFDAINEYYDNALDAECAQLITQVGEYSYYYYDNPDSNVFGDIDEDFEPVYAEEYALLKEMAYDSLTECEYYEPAATYENTLGQ